MRRTRYKSFTNDTSTHTQQNSQQTGNRHNTGFTRAGHRVNGQKRTTLDVRASEGASSSSSYKSGGDAGYTRTRARHRVNGQKRATLGLWSSEGASSSSYLPTSRALPVLELGRPNTETHCKKDFGFRASC